MTIEKVFAALIAYAEFLHRPESVQEIRRPPVRKARNVAPKSLERNERNRLLRAVEQSGNLRDTAIVYLLMDAGLWDASAPLEAHVLWGTGVPNGVDLATVAELVGCSPEHNLAV